ncbi:DUF4214 domain-containing protein [Acidimicrobiia bacterium EGI L10123]|uniref:DUF4214 domain-containing protein n=1 Tax=Salinilacustrithrix flava TaxID=2957203 RepID=UPI003D7C316D|nr:DUF4214 domain-containing protein [Acidimicrobiia bacterium EGI L10123]
MLRTLGTAALVGALTAPLLAAPVAALEPARAGVTDGASEAPVVDAIAPAAGHTDADGDLLTENVVVLPLAVDGRHLDLVPVDDQEEHGHADVALRSGVVSLPSNPEMVIFEDVAAGTHLAVRSRNADTWSDWIEVEASPDDAPDGEALTNPGVGPVWVGHGATHVEVAVLEGDTDVVRVVGLHDVEDEGSGYQGIRASATTPMAAAQTSGAFIRPRSDWATSDMGWKCSSGPTEMKEVRAMVVHHTAGSTEPYLASDVPKILRGIWNYHVGTNKWCDVAYAFFVDRFGGVWEGRQGGIDKAIMGGHTYGFNSDTTSVAQLGHFDKQSTPWAMTAATRQLVGWKLGVHGLDPSGTTTVTNNSGATFRGTANGDEHTAPIVAGHKDLRDTACPGANTYATLPYLRDASVVGAHVVALHETFMRALPTPDQYRRWLSRADNDGLRAAATGMARSETYSGVIIDDLYQRVLGRSADQEGKDYWLGVLASGVRIETVGISFYGSQEYFDRKGGAEPFVRSLYENLLHREADQDGLAYWVGMLQNRRALPPDVASGFYLSLESRLDRAARVYEHVLGRQPSGQAQQHWAQQLLSTDDVRMAIELSLSDEFYERATTS